MNHAVEFIGGPRDGDVEYHPILPRRFLHVARPEDYYERVMAATFDANNVPDRPLLIEGLYDFDRLTWTFSYWDGVQRPVTAGLYVWKGYR